MEVLSDVPSHRQYLLDAIESNYDCKGSESLWEPSFPQVAGQHANGTYMLDTFSCTGSSNGNLLREMVAKLDVIHKGKPTSIPKVRPLSCQPYIKKSSRGGWKPSTNHALKREVGSLLNEGLVYVNYIPVLLNHSSEFGTNQMYLSNDVLVPPNSMVVHNQNSEIQSFGGGELPHLYLDSTSEEGEIAHPYARSPVDSTSISLMSSESSTCNEVLGSSEIQLMDTLFDQSIMLGYGTEPWFEDPFSNIPAIHSHTNDGCFISYPNMEESTADVKVETSTHVYDGTKAAHSQGFLGSTDCHPGNNSITLPLNESNEILKRPRIDFEESFVQAHKLAQEGKILIQGSAPSGCTQFRLPRPISGSSSYSFTQKLHVTSDGFNASPTTCASGSKSLDRYTDGRQVNATHESSSVISSCSHASKGGSMPQMLKSVKSEDIMNAFCSSKMVDLGSSVSHERRHYDTRSANNYMEIGSVRLLTAAAEAVARGDMQLASVILVRLKDMISCSDNTMERVSVYFLWSLERQIQSVKGVVSGNNSRKSEGDILAAFQILHEIFPYIKFGHFTANQAILEAVQGASKVHIVDFEILEGIQWPAFMQALVSRKGGPPELRITALCRPKHEQGVTTVRRTCKRLSEFASAMGLPFSYRLLAMTDDEGVHASQIEVVHGEALVVNCMVHLPHMPQHTMATVTSFLCTMRKFSPCIVTLVEEELGCSTTAAASFFSEALYHFHAICDSLEACLPSEVEERMLVERVFMAPRIDSAISMWSRAKLPCSVYGAEITDKYKWSTIMHSAGFKPLPLSFHNQAQAKLLLGLHKHGFKLEERSHHLVLGWQLKPLYAASMWN